MAGGAGRPPAADTPSRRQVAAPVVAKRPREFAAGPPVQPLPGHGPRAVFGVPPFPPSRAHTARRPVVTRRRARSARRLRRISRRLPRAFRRNPRREAGSRPDRRHDRRVLAGRDDRTRRAPRAAIFRRFAARSRRPPIGSARLPASRPVCPIPIAAGEASPSSTSPGGRRSSTSRKTCGSTPPGRGCCDGSRTAGRPPRPTPRASWLARVMAGPSSSPGRIATRRSRMPPSTVAPAPCCRLPISCKRAICTTRT